MQTGWGWTRLLLTAVSSDFIEVNGPASLGELVATVDTSAPPPTDEIAKVLLGGAEQAVIQYDEDDKWPYMISIESHRDDEEAVRTHTLAIVERLRGTVWTFQAVDSDDIPIARS